MAWDKAFDWPILGWFIRKLGAFPVNSQPAGAFRNSIATLKDGGALVIFPEGAREFSDGKPLPFKKGAARIALQAGVPILPVTVRGGNRVWPQRQRLPRFFRRVEITYHPVIEVPSEFSGSPDTNRAADALSERLRQTIFSGKTATEAGPSA
jgi:1-acyl-sn-glycerol-3-phosphate acyltransferase